MILIGSRALFPQLSNDQITDQGAFKRVKKADYDVLMTTDEFDAWKSLNAQYLDIQDRPENKYKAILIKDGQKKMYEIEIGLSGTSAEFLLRHSAQVISGDKVEGILNENFDCLSLPFLFLTKKSHIIYPVHFEKNIKDYHTLKDILGDFEQTDIMKEYYTLRSSEAKLRYSQKTPNLSVSNDDFFNNKLSVPKYFIHDDIHEAVKHHDIPVYEMMKTDLNSAWCQKDLFFNLPFEKQIQAVQEEAYTIALERYIVPQNGDFSKDHLYCYKRAVRRICTTLCSGWFRQFAIDNYPVVLQMYDSTFAKRLEKAILDGQLIVNEGTLEDVPYVKKYMNI